MDLYVPKEMWERGAHTHRSNSREFTFGRVQPQQNHQFRNSGNHTTDSKPQTKRASDGHDSHEGMNIVCPCTHRPMGTGWPAWHTVTTNSRAYTPYRADAPSRSAFVAWTSLTPCVSSSIQVVAFQPSFSHARSIASRCRKLLRTNACALPNPNSPPILAKLDKVCSRCPPRDRDHRLASPLVSTCWSTYNWQSKSEPGGHVPVTAVSRKSALYFWQSAAGDGGDRVSDDPVTLSLPCLWLSEHQSSSRWLSIHKSEKGDGGDEVTGCCRHSLCVHVSHTMPMQIVFCAMGFLSCTLFLYLIF
jgi:hypothetical protein